MAPVTSPQPENDQWHPDVLKHLRTPSSSERAVEVTAAPERTAYRPATQLSVLAQRPRRLHRQVSTRAGQSWSRRWAALIATVVRGDDEPDRRAEALTRIQAPVTTGRRIIVTGTHGGAGGTTVALVLANVLHAHRPDGVVLLDVAGGAGGLISRLTQAPTMGVRAADRHLRADRPEVVLRQHVRPLRAVLTPADPDPAAARAVVDRLQRRVGFSVVDTDAGHLDALTPGADTLVLVAENTVRGLGCVNAAVRQRITAGLALERVVVVIIERVADSGMSGQQAVAEVHRHHQVPVVTVPRDRHLAGGADLRFELLAPATSTAFLQMAAEIVRRSGAS